MSKVRARAGQLSSLFLLLCLISCQGKPQPQVEAYGQTMGTTYSVKVVLTEGVTMDQQSLKSLADQAFVEVNQSMSTYIDDSELSKWNRMDKSWVTLSDPLLHVLSLSRTISDASGGAFDVTVMPLVNLWGFGPDKGGDVPSDAEIQARMKSIGYHQIQLNIPAKQASKPKNVHVDLSAIAKGYGADFLAERLIQKGVQHFMVEVGGELRVQGLNRTGVPWTIGIETPTYNLLESPKGPAAAVAISNVGMATSGDYRNYYEADGKRISHTIDPTTGRPITHRLASVSVIAPTCAQADAWATALNVLGPEKALVLAKKQEIAAYFIIRTDTGFESKMTESFKAYMAQ